MYLGNGFVIISVSFGDFSVLSPVDLLFTKLLSLSKLLGIEIAKAIRRVKK